jgi:hypothetical protein
VLGKLVNLHRKNSCIVTISLLKSWLNLEIYDFSFENKYSIFFCFTDYNLKINVVGYWSAVRHQISDITAETYEITSVGLLMPG